MPPPFRYSLKPLDLLWEGFSIKRDKTKSGDLPTCLVFLWILLAQEQASIRVYLFIVIILCAHVKGGVYGACLGACFAVFFMG